MQVTICPATEHTHPLPVAEVTVSGGFAVNVTVVGPMTGPACAPSEATSV